MSFERQRRVATLWAWLPTFRAAAEYESLQRASLALGVSVSGVSRAIKQLEAALGAAVFVRHKTGVRLTPRGAALLEATRTGMRLVDDAMETRGPWRVAADAPFLPLLTAAAMPTGSDCQLCVMPGGDAGTALTMGVIDLAVVTRAVRRAAVECVAVGEVALRRCVPKTVPRDAPLVDAPGIDVSTLIELAVRQRRSLLLPQRLVPVGWSDEAAPSLPVFAAWRQGTVARARPLVDGLRALLR
ncbi:MAG: LysR family transcriptional regulator [Archangium sp.]